MRKAKLLSTVAAAFLLTAGAASAQGMSKDNPERAPAAQQNAPAEKVAPSMKGGEHKAPQTTGQATPDVKSGKAHETTGQAPKSDADSKVQTQNKSMEHDKSGSAASNKSDTDVHSKSEESGRNGASSRTTETEHNRATTGQGAGGAARLSTEQRTKITSIIREHRVEPAHVNVSISVGTRIPTSVHLYPLPTQVITIYPEWRGYEYILVGDQIVVIDPRTHEIVAVLEA